MTRTRARKHHDNYSLLKVTIQGREYNYWYMIAEPEPEVGFMYAQLEDCYVTNLDGTPCPELNVSDEDWLRLENLAFDNKDEP